MFANPNSLTWQLILLMFLALTYSDVAVLPDLSNCLNYNNFTISNRNDGQKEENLTQVIINWNYLSSESKINEME